MKNKKTKLFLFLIFFGAAATISTAQSSLIIDASQMMTNFSYKNSVATKDKGYSTNYSGAYTLGYLYHINNNIVLRGGLGMRKAGATLIVDNTNYEWDLQYANIKLGGGYIYGDGRFQPYLMLSGYFGYLLKANQRINNEDFDIIDLGSLDKTDIGIIVSPGVQMKISDDITAYSEFGVLRGLKNIETTADGQKANNTAYSLTLGLAFTIK